MIEILNTILPTKNLKYALRHIYGINSKIALDICKKLGLNPTQNITKLNSKQLKELKNYIEKIFKNKAGYILKKKINSKIELLITMRAYRGIRHKGKLPVRGQRTHSNARTQKKMHRIGGGNKD